MPLRAAAECCWRGQQLSPSLPAHSFPPPLPAPLQLYRHAGVSASGFQGVPLFQAEVRPFA